MKNLFLSAILLSSVFHLHAQSTVPNGDFENWYSYKKCSGKDSLESYITYDEIIYESTGYCPPTPIAVKTTDAYTGKYALKLNPFAIGSSYSASAVYSSLGYSATTINGVPFTDSPSTLSGYFKFNQVGGDPLTIIVQLLNADKNYVGWGSLTQNSSVTKYTKFEIPISYDFGYPGPVDALVISFNLGDFNKTSGATAHKGTQLIVDNLAFEYPATATINYSNTSPINVFAANKTISFSENVSDVHVTDITGASKIQETSDTKTVNAAALSTGLYIVSYKYNDHYFTQKVVIE